MSLRRRLRLTALAVCVALAAGLAGLPAGAVEAPPGSKNFNPPANVPNYFSNESGPFQGGAAARTAHTGAGPIFAAPAPRRTIATAARRYVRHHARHVARARGRFRLARGKASAQRYIAHRHIAHAPMARRGKAWLTHARAGPARGKAAAASKRPAPSKGKRLVRAHG
jgi:hypothetical protein